MGEYDRSTLSSSINYLGLFLSPAVSYYSENAHTASSTIDIALPGYAASRPNSPPADRCSSPPAAGPRATTSH